MSQFTFPYQAGIISNVQRAGAYLKAAEWAGATHNLAIKAVNLKNANPVQATVKWATGNPGKAAAIGAGAVCVAAPMLVVTPALAAVGFSANGVVGGTLRGLTSQTNQHRCPNAIPFRLLLQVSSHSNVETIHRLIF